MESYVDSIEKGEVVRLSNREELRQYIFEYSEWVISQIQKGGQDRIPNEIYLIVKDIWDTDIRENQKTKDSYNYEVGVFEQQLLNTVDINKLIDKAKKENRNFLSSSRIRSKMNIPLIDRGYNLAISPPVEGFTFGHYVNEKRTDYTSSGIPNLVDTYRDFEFIMKGYANAMFDSYLEKFEKGLKTDENTSQKPDDLESDTPFKKIVWSGTPAEIAYIFDELATKGYIELPKNNKSKFTNVLLQHFEVKQQKGNEVKHKTIIDYLGYNKKSYPPGDFKLPISDNSGK